MYIRLTPEDVLMIDKLTELISIQHHMQLSKSAAVLYALNMFYEYYETYNKTGETK